MDMAFIRCSIQVALLGHITPTLRAVAIEHKINEANIVFYYDSVPSEDEKELANLTHTEFISDFPPSLKSDFQIICLSTNNRVPNQGMLVYSRYES